MKQKIIFACLCAMLSGLSLFAQKTKTSRINLTPSITKSLLTNDCEKKCDKSKVTSDCDCDCQCLGMLSSNNMNTDISDTDIGEDIGEDCDSGVCIPVSWSKLKKGLIIKNPYKNILKVRYTNKKGKLGKTLYIKPGKSLKLSYKEASALMKSQGDIKFKMNTTGKNPFSGNVRVYIKDRKFRTLKKNK